MTTTYDRPGAENTGANDESCRGTRFTDQSTLAVPIGYKRCTRCREVKPRSEFHRNRKAADGLHWWCKACHAAYRAENLHVSWESYYRARATAFGVTPVVKSFTKSELVAAYGDSCIECGGDWDQLDHVVPVRLGGEHSLDNCRPICDPCHKVKSSDGVAAIVAARNGTRVPDADEKICIDCKRVLPRSTFGRDKSRHDGLHPRCRACQRERNRARYARNGELTPLQKLKRGIFARTITFNVTERSA